MFVKLVSPSGTIYFVNPAHVTHFFRKAFDSAGHQMKEDHTVLCFPGDDDSTLVIGEHPALVLRKFLKAE